MATTTRMFCFVLVMVLMGCCCSAKIYKVGDSKGWTTAKHGSYYEWAKLKKFQVGDSLMFEYDGNINDVTQVSSRLEYQFCNSLSPKAVYNTGHDVVTLMEPGYHFFITSNRSQCVAGHKLVVFVVHDHPMIPPPPPPRKILPLGKDYKVGDSNEWRVPEESDFYSKWSEEKQFHVGDNLLFYYNDQVDDLLEINSDLEFKSCDTTSPVAVHNAGQDLIRLTKPGIRYFITSKIGHCEAGLKLRVVVQPLSKSVPKKMQLSPFDRLIKWLHDSFTPHPHH
ncbi:blue copper protein-like [Brassica napus]|uniref:blue copper protein-like n=1 Tax=Brassica napus TaxID=3708 RepID=UPI002078E641|nr:blue copper protein-like [Brassica napus]